MMEELMSRSQEEPKSEKKIEIREPERIVEIK